MRWHNPVPLILIPTSDSQSFSAMPAGTTGLPVGGHPGAFGVQRKHHTHEGVDLYVPEFTGVMAVEDGVVVKVAPFTGPLAGASLSHWRDTQAVFVEGASGVVVYGEIEPSVKEGDQLIAGQYLGRVIRVLLNDKGRPMSMLHLELHTAGSRVAPEWLDHNNKPAVLLDPTPLLLTCLDVQDDTQARAVNDRTPILAVNMEYLRSIVVGKNPNSEGLESLIIDLHPRANGNAFPQARRIWLRNLPTTLREGWLAGGGNVTGSVPSAEAVDCAIAVFNQVIALPCKNADWATDGILMGALPAGGIAFEIRWEDGRSYIVNILNTGEVDLEVLGATESTEHASTFADVPSALAALMKSAS